MIRIDFSKQASYCSARSIGIRIFGNCADHPLSVDSFPMNASFRPAKLPNIWAVLATVSRDTSSLHVVLLSRSCGAGKVSDMAQQESGAET
jgi:hypothetical protein